MSAPFPYECVLCNVVFNNMDALMEHELTETHQSIINQLMFQARVGVQPVISQSAPSKRHHSKRARSKRTPSQPIILLPPPPKSALQKTKSNKKKNASKVTFKLEPAAPQPGPSEQDITLRRLKARIESRVVPFVSLESSNSDRPRKRIESQYPKKFPIEIPLEVQQGLRELELSDLPDPSSREKTLDVKRWMRQAFRAQIETQIEEGREDAEKAGEEPDMFKITEDLGPISMGDLSCMLRDIKRRRKEVRKRGRERRRQREREEMEEEEDEEDEEATKDGEEKPDKEEQREEKMDEHKEEKQDEKEKA